jgi:hypothetical protein
VASTTLDSVEQWSGSTLIKGPVADFVAELRERDGGTIGVTGSPSLVRSLIEAGLRSLPPGEQFDGRFLPLMRHCRQGEERSSGSTAARLYDKLNTWLRSRPLRRTRPP